MRPKSKKKSSDSSTERKLMAKEEKKPSTKATLFSRTRSSRSDAFSRDGGTVTSGEMTSGDYSEESSSSSVSTGSSGSYDDRETTASEASMANQREFDRKLRAKHAEACKHMKTGSFDKALEEFESILAAIFQRYGDVHYRVGAALHNVGIANLRAGKLDDAMDAIEEAVRIRKLTLGSEDPKVADSLVELGIVLLSMKEYSDALEIFYEALELRELEAEEFILPEDIKDSNMRIAKVMNNVGCVSFERGNFAEAKKAFEDAVKLQKEALGEIQTYDGTAPTPGVLTMATTMCNMGYVYLERAEFTESAKIFEESLKIQKLFLGADNKLILNTLDNMGFAYAMQPSYDKAIKVYEALLANQQKSYEETQLDCASTIRKLIFLRLKLSQYDQALKDLCLLEDIQLENFGPDSKLLKQTQDLMGQVNYQVFKYPSLTESVARSFKSLRLFGGVCGSDVENDEIDLTDWWPKKPVNNSKMSGHRVTYA